MLLESKPNKYWPLHCSQQDYCLKGPSPVVVVANKNKINSPIQTTTKQFPGLLRSFVRMIYCRRVNTLIKYNFKWTDGSMFVQPQRIIITPPESSTSSPGQYRTHNQFILSSDWWFQLKPFFISAYRSSQTQCNHLSIPHRMQVIILFTGTASHTQREETIGRWIQTRIVLLEMQIYSVAF